jgi:hypothetical protein
MTLVAATSELMAADLAGIETFSESIGADVPENWPPELYENTAMRAALVQLQDPAEHGWSVWYLLSRKPEVPQVLGICGFKGMPDEVGSVEIG